MTGLRHLFYISAPFWLVNQFSGLMTKAGCRLTLLALLSRLLHLAPLMFNHGIQAALLAHGLSLHLSRLNSCRLSCAVVEVEVVQVHHYPRLQLKVVEVEVEAHSPLKYS
jgi:hypothetical protein